MISIILSEMFFTIKKALTQDSFLHPYLNMFTLTVIVYIHSASYSAETTYFCKVSCECVAD